MPSIDRVTVSSFAWLSDLFEKIRSVRKPGQEIYLVGGAVRDLLMNKRAHDLDFVLPGDAQSVARKTARVLGAAFFPLDEERDIARILAPLTDGSQLTIDFSAFRGPDLDSDLRARDFTIDAMAINLNAPEQVIDPLGGAEDLKQKLIRACSPTSITDDPLRVMRAVRLAIALNGRIVPTTLDLVRSSVSGLERVSAERKRDELFRILEGPRVASAFRILAAMGVFPYVLPELIALSINPALWNEACHTSDSLARLLSAIGREYHPDSAANLRIGLAVNRLGRYRQQIQEHLSSPLTPMRSLTGLLYLAAFYQQVGKVSPQVGYILADKQDRDWLAAQLVENRARELQLSNDEIERLAVVLRYQKRVHRIAQERKSPSRKEIYHFFKDAGPAGIDICLLSLANLLAESGPDLSEERWSDELNVCRILFENWWEKPEESIAPPALIDGNILLSEFHLRPGPVIGDILESVREAQATGQVKDRASADEFIRTWLGERGDHQA